MDRQVDQLTALVDELLDLSRIAQGKIELAHDALDVRTLVAAAIEDTRSLADQLGHRISVAQADEPLVVSGDRTRLLQVFVNLLANAFKYTPDGGAVHIESRRTGEAVLVSIRDTGVGLAPDQLETMFELFAQSRDARGRSRGGLGIGLNVVRRLVEMHGGTVIATSPGLGAGATLTVELPVHD